MGADRSAAPSITVISGGVGAARFLRGLISAVADPALITAVVNTGDDCILHGLSISPDLDTITYTLADAIDPGRGWGLVDETWTAMAALERFEAVRPAGSAAAPTLVQPRRQGPGDPLLPHRPPSRGCQPHRCHRRDPPRLGRADPYHADVRRSAVDDGDRRRRRRADRDLVPGLLRPPASRRRRGGGPLRRSGGAVPVGWRGARRRRRRDRAVQPARLDRPDPVARRRRRCPGGATRLGGRRVTDRRRRRPQGASGPDARAPPGSTSASSAWRRSTPRSPARSSSTMPTPTWPTPSRRPVCAASSSTP